ncbi:hypothetical protein RB195_013994 [Necator americanus]|uniref:Reverse transcriptase domain-containing protein n=1 Tax=Necator americanus TaxID=51031 RepID=A0ABR1DY40_NECAM
MAMCTYNAPTLVLEETIEDLMMQARNIKYGVIGLTETMLPTQRRAQLEQEGVNLNGSYMGKKEPLKFSTKTYTLPRKNESRKWSNNNNSAKTSTETSPAQLNGTRDPIRHRISQTAVGKKTSPRIVQATDVDNVTKIGTTTNDKCSDIKPDYQTLTVTCTVCPQEEGTRTDIPRQPGRKIQTGANKSDHQTYRIHYDIIELTESRRRHSLSAMYDTGEELFLGTCDNKGVRGVGVLKTKMANIFATVTDEESEEFQTTKRRLSPKTLEVIRQRGATPAAGNQELTSELAKLCREAVKEDLKERRAGMLAEAAEAGQSIRYARRNFANHKTTPDGTTTASGRGMEKIIHESYSDLFDSHVHVPSHHLRENGHVIPKILSSIVRHAIMCMKNHASPGLDRIKPEHLKYLPPVHLNTLARLFTRYLSNARFLSDGKPARSCCCIRSAALENLMRGMEWDDMGVKVDRMHLHYLRFADDIVLMTTSINQAERMLAEFSEMCRRIGLQLNPDKTTFVKNRWLCISMSGNQDDERPDLRAEQKDTSGFERIQEHRGCGGIIEITPSTRRKTLHYIPHQADITVQKEATEMRIVFEAPFHFKKAPSPDDVLATQLGPPNLPEIYAVLARSQTSRYNISNHHLLTHVGDHQLAGEIREDHYVDNLAVNSTYELRDEALRSRHIFSDININLRQLLSNDTALQNGPPEEAHPKPFLEEWRNANRQTTNNGHPTKTASRNAQEQSNVPRKRPLDHNNRALLPTAQALEDSDKNISVKMD